MRQIIFILALLAFGCAHSRPAQPAAPAVIQQPFILHIPGVSGESVVDHSLVEGLTESFAAVGGAEIQIYDWTEHDPGIPALQAYARNHAQAAKIAKVLADHVKADPHRAIYVTCHSGGAGLAAWALEQMPAGTQITSVLFLAPALSPQYDLSVALEHVRSKAYVFWSDRDFVILNTGTKLFGTIDGVYVAAAGFGGFVKPPSASAGEYAKLKQIPYNPTWVRYGHDGDHIGPMETPFAREVVAPTLRGGGAATQPSGRP